MLAAQDQKNFAKMKATVESQMRTNPKLAKLANHVRFVATRDGMRIDLVDDADYSMFDVGTTALVPDADKLIGLIAQTISGTENPIMIRGHTDSLPYGDPRAMNNWMLSSGRAEATRRRLASGGVPETRFYRIEGVADREPMIEKDPKDPRNRRVAITLLYRAGAFGQ
jgi:chemotaxis protein MotB